LWSPPSRWGYSPALPFKTVATSHSLISLGKIEEQTSEAPGFLG